MKGKKRVARAARELYRLCLRDGGLDEGRARQVAQRLVASTRRGALPLLSSFQRLVRLDSDRRSALVESATALEPGLREAITQQLVRLYGARIDTTFEENPALIGGVRIRIGSDVIDGSVRARLLALEASL